MGASHRDPSFGCSCCWLTPEQHPAAKVLLAGNGARRLRRALVSRLIRALAGRYAATAGHPRRVEKEGARSVAMPLISHRVAAIRKGVRWLSVKSTHRRAHVLTNDHLSIGHRQTRLAIELSSEPFQWSSNQSNEFNLRQNTRCVYIEGASSRLNFNRRW